MWNTYKYRIRERKKVQNVKNFSMMKLTCVIIFCVIIEFARADLCQENITLAEFPGGIRDEVISLILTGTIGIFTGCPTNNPVLPEQVKLFLYNLNDFDNPILLDKNDPVQVDPSKPVVFVIHGWTCSINGTRMPEIIKAYLGRGTVNVIGVDWSERSVDLYANAFCSIPGVGDIIAAFICILLNANPTQKMHVIGHSMGGQIAGYTGQYVQSRCNRVIDRITGLDPAAPLFQDKPPEQRLDKLDSNFVDVIHTSIGVVGFAAPCGHADFYPNCGAYQWGCTKFTTPQQLLNLPLSIAACSHFRSCDYWIESTKPRIKNFIATSCATCPLVCLADILNPTKVEMGEDCPNTIQGAKFYLSTNAQSPFAQG